MKYNFFTRYKDEEEIKSSEHFVIKEDGDSYLLRITGAVTTDASKYKFKALNIHGSSDDEVRVDVKKAPKIIQGLHDMTVTEHDKDVALDVKLEAFPKPAVKWYKIIMCINLFILNIFFMHFLGIWMKWKFKKPELNSPGSNRTMESDWL